MEYTYIFYAYSISNNYVIQKLMRQFALLSRSLPANNTLDALVPPRDRSSDYTES